MSTHEEFEEQADIDKRDAYADSMEDTLIEDQSAIEIKSEILPVELRNFGKKDNSQSVLNWIIFGDSRKKWEVSEGNNF